MLPSLCCATGVAERDLDTAWMLRWGPEFVELLDNPAVSPMLGEVLGVEYSRVPARPYLLHAASRGEGRWRPDAVWDLALALWSAALAETVA